MKGDGLTAQQRYEKYRTNIVLRLNRRTDKDVLEWLKGQQNKQGKIKTLIRAEIARENERSSTMKFDDKMNAVARDLENKIEFHKHVAIAAYKSIALTLLVYNNCAAAGSENEHDALTRLCAVCQVLDRIGIETQFNDWSSGMISAPIFKFAIRVKGDRNAQRVEFTADEWAESDEIALWREYAERLEKERGNIPEFDWDGNDSDTDD